MEISQVAEAFERTTAEIGKVFVGQDELVEGTLIALLCEGNVLIEGVPGLGKTLLVNVLSKVLSCQFKRVQFTPDLMPSDLTGHSIYNSGDQKFVFNRGPIFTNLLLADEVNRAPAKTQSALLEVMQERQVTVDGHTYILDRPFITLATQNPLEQEGTYPLPEAQLDRFMMEIQIGYPSPQQEEEIVLRTTGATPPLPDAAFDRETFLQLRDLVLAVPVPQSVAAYSVRLCGGSRPGDERADRYVNDYVAWGAGPRGSQNLVLAAKAKSLLDGRTVPTAQDLRAVAVPVLRHRVVVNHRAVGDGIKSEHVVKHLLETVPM